MKETKRNRMTGSLHFKSMAILGAVYLPLLILLLFSMLYSVNVLKRKSYETESQLIRYYTRSLDGRLENLEDYLKSYTTTNSAVQALAFSDSYPEKYQFYKYLAYQELVTAVSSYESVDYMYIYDPGRQKCYIAGNAEKDYRVRESLEKQLGLLFENGGRTAYKWNCFEAGRSYLMRDIKYGNIHIGILLKAENVINEKDYFTSDSNVLLCDEQGRCVESLFPLPEGQQDGLKPQDQEWIRIDGVRYLQVHAASTAGEFYLAGIIPQKAVYENVPRVYLVSLMLLLAGLLLIPVCVALMKKEILKPITGMTEAISLITEGDMETRAAPGKNMAEEFQIIYESFNHMMDQIGFLQEEILEKQKREQRLEQQQLQYQIRPHFFLNALNGIYGLAETGQDALIQKVVLSLSRYFRYIFGADRNFVEMEEECRYVDSYAQIRRLLQKELLSVEIALAAEAREALIPPFTVMTFVENAYKHGALANRPLHIGVKVEPDPEKEYLSIEVLDDGKGFSKEVLQALGDHRLLANTEGEHMGIFNVCERLRISYEEQVFVSFENRPEGGGLVRLRVPFYRKGGEADVPDPAGG